MNVSHLSVICSNLLHFDYRRPLHAGKQTRPKSYRYILHTSMSPSCTSSLANFFASLCLLNCNSMTCCLVNVNCLQRYVQQDINVRPASHWAATSLRPASTYRSRRGLDVLMKNVIYHALTTTLPRFYHARPRSRCDRRDSITILPRAASHAHCNQ